MGRPKIDKTSIEYLSKNLFHDGFVGFQFTAGRTPKGITDKRRIYMSCDLSLDNSGPVIDCSESELEDKIMSEIFPDLDAGNSSSYSVWVTKEYLTYLQGVFRELDLEVEECDFAGYWYWFRVKCSAGEIRKYVDLLKEKIVLPNK